MPPARPESDLDEELLAITGGVEVQNIPDADVEKLNKVLGFYLRRWGKEFDTNALLGHMQKKTESQHTFTNFIYERMRTSVSGFALRLEIVEPDDLNKQASLLNFKSVKKNPDGLFEVEIQSVDKHFSSAKKRPFALLPETKPVLEVDEDDNGLALLLNPNDIYSLSFVVPEKE